MALPFEFDTRFLTEEHIGDEKHSITETDIEKYRNRGARCLREMRKAKKNGQLPQYVKDRRIRSTVREIQSHADRLGKDCDALLVVGMGGSTLGTQAILESLLPSYWNERTSEGRGGKPRVYFLDNVDPDEVLGVLEIIDLKRTVIVYASKSGQTAETMANYHILRERMVEADPERHHQRTVMITGEHDSYLAREAEAHNYRRLHFPENLGGRWSVLTPVGLFPAAMVGIDIGRLIDGAIEVEHLCTEHDIDANPALRAALLYWLFDFKKKKKVHVLWHYSSRLTAFARWFQQLWAESLGKAYAHTGKEVHAGTLPVPSLGTADQHSMLQFYLEGPADKVVTFVSIDEDRNRVEIPQAKGEEGEPTWLFGRTLAELRRYERQGTTYALTADGRPSVDLRINRLDEFSLGALFYFWELVVAYTATLYGVNAYDQPAVELGKWATQALMGDPEHSELKDEVEYTLSPPEEEEGDEEEEGPEEEEGHEGEDDEGEGDESADASEGEEE